MIHDFSLRKEEGIEIETIKNPWLAKFLIPL